MAGSCSYLRVAYIAAMQSRDSGSCIARRNAAREMMLILNRFSNGGGAGGRTGRQWAWQKCDENAIELWVQSMVGLWRLS